MLNPHRNDLRLALCALGYIGVLLLGCSNKSWQAAPAAPPAESDADGRPTLPTDFLATSR